MIPYKYRMIRKRILRQADDLIKKQTILGEYKTKQTAALVNNLNIEFERSKRQRDENFRRRQKQNEINFKIKQAEGQQNLQAAQKQATLNQAFKQQKDAQRMQAFANAAQTASQAGSSFVKAKGAEAAEAGKAQAQKEALQKKVTETNNAVNPVLNAEPIPGSEVVGQTVRDSIEDTVIVSQENQSRFEASESDGQVGGREFNLLERMFGVERSFQTAYQKEQNKIIGQNFSFYEAKVAAEGQTPVQVTVNGVEQTVMYGDAMLERNPLAKQEALTQILNKYTKDNGIDKQDPVMAAGYFQEVNGFFNEQLNDTFVNLEADLQAKALGAARAKLAASGNTRADVSSYINRVSSIVSVEGAKEQLEKAVINGDLTFEELSDAAKNDSWFPNSKNTIAETDGGWLQTLQYESATIFRRKDEALQTQMFEEKVVPLLDQAVAVATKDGIASEADMATAYTKLLPGLKAMGVSEEYQQKAKQRLDSKAKFQRSVAASRVEETLKVSMQAGTLNRAQIQEAAPIIGTAKANEYLEAISPGSTAQIPEGFTREKIEKELTSALTSKLLKNPNVGSQRAHESLYPAARVAYTMTMNKYRAYMKEGAIASPQQAMENAIMDVRNEISTANEGDTFGVVPAAQNSTDMSFFPSFTRNQGNLMQQTGWQPDADEQELTRRVNAHTGTQKVPLNKIEFYDKQPMDAIENQIISNSPVNIPSSAYGIAYRLGVPVEELINSQLEFHGKTARLEGVTALTAIQQAAPDPLIQAWIPQFPTQANVNAAIALGGNYPRTFQSGPKGWEQMKAAAQLNKGALPDFAAVMWATATKYGTTEAYITDPSGNKMAAGSPKEYVEWANQQVQMDIDAGRLNPAKTYSELIAEGSIGKQYEAVLRSQGMLGQKPIKKLIATASPSTNGTVAYITGSMTHGVESVAGEHLHVDRQDNPNTKNVNEALTYLDQTDQMMNESMLIETGKGTGKFLKPTEWVEYTSNAGYPETAAQRYGASRDGGSRQHKGYDFRSEAGSKIKLRNGAKVVKVIRGTPNGDHVVIEFKDGSRKRFLHGKYVGVSY